MNKYLKIAKDIFIPLAVGGIVSLIIMPFMDYEELFRPPLAPPGMLFPIIWGILYTLMGVSYTIADKRRLDDGDKLLYYFQLGVNALWPIAFFVLKWRLFAFIWILFLAVLVYLMIKMFYKYSKLAAYLQIPYLIWVLFASYLNLGIYLLN